GCCPTQRGGNTQGDVVFGNAGARFCVISPATTPGRGKCDDRVECEEFEEFACHTVGSHDESPLLESWGAGSSLVCVREDRRRNCRRSTRGRLARPPGRMNSTASRMTPWIK